MVWENLTASKVFFLLKNLYLVIIAVNQAYPWISNSFRKYSIVRNNSWFVYVIVSSVFIVCTVNYRMFQVCFWFSEWCELQVVGNLEKK